MNSMMMHGRNNGKKLMTVTIVKHSFEIIHLLTGEVSDCSLAGASTSSSKHTRTTITQGKVLTQEMENFLFLLML